MSTLTITRDQMFQELAIGDRIVAIDGTQLRRTHEVLLPRHGAGLNRIDAVALVNPLNSGTEWNLYPDQVDHDITVERPDVAEQPAPAIADPDQNAATGDYQVGDPVLVFAWGQYRHGKVTKVGRTRLTIEHRRNASGARHERTFVLGEIVRSWKPSPWTPGCWLPTMANDQRGREHIGMPPSVPTRPRREQAPATARSTGRVEALPARTAFLADRPTPSGLQWGDQARTLLRRTPGYVAVLREAADQQNGVLTVSGDNSERRSTGTTLGFAAKYGWARQLDTNPGVWQITQTGLDVILAWDAEADR